MSPSYNKITAFLKKNNIQFVRIIWTNGANLIRGKAIHTDQLHSFFDHGVGVTQAEPVIPVMYDVPQSHPILGPVGEVRLVPEWKTLRVLPYSEGHAQVFGEFRSQTQLWAYDPRNFLKQTIQKLKKDFGLEVKAAFEPEFYLVKRNDRGHIVPKENTTFASTLSLDLNAQIISEITAALKVQGITVEQFYAEAGPGQLELPLLYSDALTAADNHISLRETVNAIVRKHDFVPTFMPKVFENQAGSGCHLHLSLWKNSKNISSVNDKLSKELNAFMAGIQKHLPALMAITTPSVNSYRRLKPFTWSGAFNVWGYDNREAALRVPTEFGISNFELKTFDSAANPYLALGAVIAAGMDGLKHTLSLEDPLQENPSALSDVQLKKKHISRLPSDLGEALNHLAKDPVLLDALGEELSGTYFAIKKAEWKAMRGKSIEEEVEILLEKF